jgi:UDPglucose 6-dehydrogenase
MRITVIGTGYLGAVHAACMAEMGHEVLGVDVDVAKIKNLSAGRQPFHESGLGDLLIRNIGTGRLRFSTSLADAAAFGSLHFVCVGTPQQPGSNAADLRYVHDVVNGLAPHLQVGALVVGKSTVPVGTADRLAGRIRELAPVGAEPELAWNPEFLREGFAVRDTLCPDRLVVGVTSEEADIVLREVYAPILDTNRIPWISTNLATAELIKISANAFLATKISFINAMADVCDAAGGDVVTLADAIGYDPRIGRQFLSAGIGFGGGCLPKDIRAFIARAEELGLDGTLGFLHSVDEINMRCRQRAVDLARELVGGTLSGRNLAVLGAAFKPDSDDVRDSPALDIAVALHRKGARVRVHDPEATDNARALFPMLDYPPDIEKVCEDADLVLHLTEWRDYRELDPSVLARVVRQPRMLDGRNALDVQAWRAADWTVQALGRSPLRTRTGDGVPHAHHASLR